MTEKTTAISIFPPYEPKTIFEIGFRRPHHSTDRRCARPSPRVGHDGKNNGRHAVTGFYAKRAGRNDRTRARRVRNRIPAVETHAVKRTYCADRNRVEGYVFWNVGGSRTFQSRWTRSDRRDLRPKSIEIIGNRPAVIIGKEEAGPRQLAVGTGQRNLKILYERPSDLHVRVSQFARIFVTTVLPAC